MQVIEKTFSKKNKGGDFVIPYFKMIHSYGNQSHMAEAGEQVCSTAEGIRDQETNHTDMVY